MSSDKRKLQYRLHDLYSVVCTLHLFTKAWKWHKDREGLCGEIFGCHTFFVSFSLKSWSCPINCCPVNLNSFISLHTAADAAQSGIKLILFGMQLHCFPADRVRCLLVFCNPSAARKGISKTSKNSHSPLLHLKSTVTMPAGGNAHFKHILSLLLSFICRGFIVRIAFVWLQRQRVCIALDKSYLWAKSSVVLECAACREKGET